MRLLFRVLIILVVIYAGLSAIRGLLGSSVPTRRRGPAAPPSGHLVKDPVCGMYIPQDTAIRAAEQFFCSEGCREKFISQT